DVLVTQGLRRLRHCRREDRPLGNALPGAVLLACAAYFVAAQFGDVSWYNADQNPSRAPFARQLAEAEGSHLVLVRYSSQPRSVDWVYNGPDVEEGKVVWARQLGCGRGR